MKRSYVYSVFLITFGIALSIYLVQLTASCQSPFDYWFCYYNSTSIAIIGISYLIIGIGIGALATTFLSKYKK